MSGSFPSLWQLIAPFDHQGQFLSRFLWPLLSDEDALQAMMANRATMAQLPHLTVRHAFTLSELLSLKRSTRRLPRISSVTDATPARLQAALSRLPHVTSLELNASELSKTGEWSVQLPASLTHLYLTVPSRLWQQLSAVSLPAALQELTIDDDVTGGFLTERYSGPLPPHVHTLSIRTCWWDWSTFQQQCLPADSTQLRSLTVAANYSDFGFNEMDPALLPHSLTLLDLSGYERNGPVSDFNLPSLTILRLGRAPNVGRGFSVPIAVHSFVGLPALRELDLRLALFFNAPLPAGALPVTLTRLALPLNYYPPVLGVAGVLPASLQRLQIAHADQDDVMDVDGQRDGRLPTGLLALVIEQSRDPYQYEYRLSFTYRLHMLPASLTELRVFNHSFNQALDALADMPQLATLSIHSARFAQPLGPIRRLAHLRTLELCVAFPAALPVLPSQLRHLTVRPASEVQGRAWAGEVRRRHGYIYELMARQFAQCGQLESVSIDADVFVEHISTYVFASRLEQQQRCPLFDLPIAPNVLPASLLRLRLPQWYSHELNGRAMPARCVVWKGGQQVRWTLPSECCV